MGKEILVVVTVGCSDLIVNVKFIDSGQFGTKLRTLVFYKVDFEQAQLELGPAFREELSLIFS